MCKTADNCPVSRGIVTSPRDGRHGAREAMSKQKPKDGKEKRERRHPGEGQIDV